MRPENISPALDYTRALFAPEDEVLRRIAASVPEGAKHMQVGADEGKMLYVLARMNQVKKVVEIGSLVGYSAVWIARALPGGGVLHALEKDPRHAAIIRENIALSGMEKTIQLHEGDALSSLQGLAAEAPFDMVFIDADKGGYPEYLAWAERHVRKGGLIIGDNTFLFGAVYAQHCPKGVSKRSQEAMQRFNQRLADPNFYDSIIIPTLEGLTVAVKRF